MTIETPAHKFRCTNTLWAAVQTKAQQLNTTPSQTIRDLLTTWTQQEDTK